MQQQAELQKLRDIVYGAYNESAIPLDAPPNTSGPGSRNWLRLGAGYSRPFLGMASLGANTGSRIMFRVKAGYAGLKDIGATQGDGSIFSFVNNSIFYIGAGQVSLNGTDIPGAAASSTLKILLSRAGSYTAADSGPYSAGLAQPSAPTIAGLSAPIGSGYTGTVTGAISIKIARLRIATGARSIASPTSAVIVLNKQTFRVTFPTASAGQSHWAIFAPQQGYGGVGLHLRLKYAGAGVSSPTLEIPESIIAASTIDGVTRTLEFEYKDGDLVPEEAWIQDYPPPAGTHGAPIENCVIVGGCYPDATNTTPSTASNPGTAMAVSLPNFPESFNPTHLLYLPGMLVSLMGRPSDSYLYAACRDSVHAIQYIGGGQSGPACAITTIWPDIGIEKPGNWCQVQGRIYAFVAKGGICRMGDAGEVDYEFASPVANYVKNWTTASTVVSWNPATLTVVYSNGRISLTYSLQTGDWSPPVYIDEFAAGGGTILSAINTQGQMKVTMANGATHTAYDFDVQNAAFLLISAVSQYSDEPESGRIKTVREVLPVIEHGASGDVWISVHRNGLRTYVDDAQTTAASSTVTSPTGPFTSSMVGFHLLISKAGALLWGKIGAYISPTQVSLVDPSTGAPLTATATATAQWMLIARRVVRKAAPRFGVQHLRPARVKVKDCRSFAIGVTYFTNTPVGQVAKASVFGDMSDSVKGVST